MSGKWQRKQGFLSKDELWGLVKSWDRESRAGRQGGVSDVGFFSIWTCPSFLSFLVPCCPFWDFPDFFGISRFFSGSFCPFLFPCLLIWLKAPTRNSPERVRDTIRTFPGKSGKRLGLKTPRFTVIPSPKRSLEQRGPRSSFLIIGFPAPSPPSQLLVLACSCHGLSGPLNWLNAILSLLDPLERCRTTSAIGSTIGRPLSRPISHPNTGGSPQPPRSKPLGGH